MASFQELMAAADNADRAGDTEAARELVQAAIRVGGLYNPAEDPNNPQGIPRAQWPNPDYAQSAASRRERDVFGDTIRDATAGPRAALRDSFSRANDPDRSTGERLGAYGETALNFLGAGMAYAAGTAGEVLGGRPTGEKKFARDLMVLSQVAIPELAGVTSATRAAGASVRAAQALERQPTMKQSAARAADEIGVTPSIGMTGKGPAMASAALEKFPGSGGVIARDAERAIGEIEGAFKRMVGNLGDTRSAAGAGDTIQAGLTRFRDRFKNQSSKLFSKVGDEIPADTRIEIPNTIRAVEEAKAAFADNPELAQRLGLNQWDRILAEAQENGMTWAALKDFRTSVGEGVGSIKGALADQSDSRLQRLYATLTQDMERAAVAAGPRAEAAWRRANTYHRSGSQRIEKQLDQLITADNPERAFEIVARMAREGLVSSDIKRLRAVRASMSKDDWNEVAASIVGRMGQKGEEFSPAAFLTDWNKLAPEAKRVLLREDVRRELDKLAEVAGSARRANLERNASNTGTVVTGAATGAAATQAPLLTLSVLAGANISARTMTNTSVLRAMNKAARGDRKPLRRIANGNSGFARDAETILRLTGAEMALVPEPANQPPQLRAVNQ